MQFLDKMMEKWNMIIEKTAPARKVMGRIWEVVKKVCKTTWKILRRLKKVFLAIPVAAAAVMIALSNMDKLPKVVGLQLASTGEFTVQVTRELAVLGPLALTALCLLLLFLSRRTLTPWLVSAVSLLVPIFIYFLNSFPA